LNVDVGNPVTSGEDGEADDESDTVRDNTIEDLERTAR
jgi:hypothetical protein